MCILFLSVIVLSCSKDDDSENNSETQNTEAQDATFEAAINGGTFTNYSFVLSVYNITKGTNGNTLSITVADSQGNDVNLFLNNTGGFGNGTVKQIGDMDSDNFVTNAVIRDLRTPISYFSTTGTITITNNREHPTEAGHNLISGNYTITASSIDGSQVTTMTGSFTELDYVN
jgi:hypothetical protein